MHPILTVLGGGLISHNTLLMQIFGGEHATIIGNEMWRDSPDFLFLFFWEGDVGS